jgi:hypothetical protein
MGATAVHAVAPVEQHAIDDHDQIRTEGRSPFEPLEDVVAAFEEPQVYGLGEVVRFVGRKAANSGNVPNRLSKQRQLLRRRLVWGSGHAASSRSNALTPIKRSH